MSKNPIFLTVLLVGLFAVTLTGAYLLGQSKGSSKSSTSSLNQNEKRLRAKTGTERKNAKALTTSRKSNETDRTDEKADVWGSLEKDQGSKSKKESLTLKKAKTALEGLPTSEAIQKISTIILATEDPEALVVPYAMLGYLYGISDSELLELSVEAFERAQELATSNFQQVEITFYQAKALSHQEKYQDVILLIGDLSLESVPENSHYFELGILAGVALEKLGEDEKAQMAYKEIMDTIKIHELNEDSDLDNIYRMAGFKLAKLYRKNGQDNSALALARQLNGDRR
jgi:hypothetical protein